MEIKLEDFNNFMWDCHKARQCRIHNDYLYMFYVAMSKPIDDKNYDNGWITLYIKYEMQKFSVYAGITEKPLPDFKEMSKSLIEVPQKFADEIKTNASFIKTLKVRLAEYAEKRGKAGASFDKVFQMLDQRGVSVQRNNMIAKTTAENAKRKAKQDADREALKKMAKTYGAGQKWSYYKEYYRGPSAPAHDDDYEGSGDCTFEDVVLALCHCEADVIKLAKAAVGAQIYKEEGRYRTIYSKKKEGTTADVIKQQTGMPDAWSKLRSW